MAEQAPAWKRWLEESGDQVIFLKGFFRNMFRGGFEWSELIRQCYEIGYKSFTLVATTAFIMGLVLALQLRPTLVGFGAASMLPRTLVIAIVREIGPVITAIICAGKMASGIGAELGSMKVTEQIDAMDVSGANPMQYLVVTRVLATTCMVPLLAIMGDVISLIGGFVAINIQGSVSLLLYYNKCVGALSFSDLLPAVIKTVFFGFAIGFIGCYKGYNSDRGTESVGLSANSAVVASSLWIFVIDAIVVQISNVMLS
ncbi:MAG TPA: ABC transporter permease [Mucilaginibacter sp.]|jgi:phospholipid/cholesterol/gamma-HCH transport system permease protein|nr:ABC transporter permease [Mucilaginibacter sp.]